MSRGIREPARPHRGELVYFQEHEQGSPGGIPGPSTESGQVMRDLKIHTAGQNGPVPEEEAEVEAAHQQLPVWNGGTLKSQKALAAQGGCS